MDLNNCEGLKSTSPTCYGDAIYLTPMVLGAMASIFAAAWRFLGARSKA
jgi:hypothetical protein